MKRGMMMLVAMSLLVVACGGNGAEETTGSAESTTGAETGPSSADTTTTKPAASEEPGSSGSEGTGTATIGDVTWEFALSGGVAEMCDLDVNDAGLILVVVMFGTDDSGREITLNISGPPSGGDAGLVQVGSPLLDFERWTADRSVYDRLSGIEGMPEGIGAAFQVDGNTVSGSGVFYDDTALTQVRGTGDPYDAGVLEGTFSATCPAG